MQQQSLCPGPCKHIDELAPYVPGLSIEEIREKYGLSEIIKLASNENPLGASPYVQETLKRHAADVFRYPQGGNPELCAAIAKLHDCDPARIVAGNGSDELIDLLMRTMANPGEHNIVCCEPCFGIYPVQAHINRLEIRRQALNKDFSFNFKALLDLVDDRTRLLFLTTPDNPSGYCPSLEQMRDFASRLYKKSPETLLVIDEAYMDFSPDEKGSSLLANDEELPNVAFLRTFSKSWGLAGARLGYAVLPIKIAEGLWRARLPFSVNILAEKAALAAIKDRLFREETLKAVHKGRQWLLENLKSLGCKVWPANGNFIMFQLPANSLSTQECFNTLLKKGIIIRPLGSYKLPDHLRVSIGSKYENMKFIQALKSCLSEKNE